MSNEKAISRLDELVVRRENEIASLRFAREQLSDPEWDERDREEAHQDEGRMVIAALGKANEADRAAAVHKDGCICLSCMPDHPRHQEEEDRDKDKEDKPASYVDMREVQWQRYKNNRER